jgi:hypothetical protein
VKPQGKLYMREVSKQRSTPIPDKDRASDPSRALRSLALQKLLQQLLLQALPQPTLL